MSNEDTIDKLISAVIPRDIVESAGFDIPDISSMCLDGFLGEICFNRMSDIPRAWAWPALLSAASVHVAHSSSIRSNLFTALVGPIGAGKTATIAIANHLLDVGDCLFDSYVGSAEGLAKNLPSEFGAHYKLWYVDELGHLLDKAKIEGASFVRVLNTCFYKDEQMLIVAKGAKYKFNCKMSIIGGIVDEDFEDAFSAITAHGMYDRFLFGYAPTSFQYNYHPLEDYGEHIEVLDRIRQVERVSADVWEYKKKWIADHPGANREFEIALRCALICATFDRRPVLQAKDLEPAMAFAEAQSKVRKFLKPNLGKNQGGEVGQKITDYLKRFAGDGNWIYVREVLRATHCSRYGMDMANRVLIGLNMCGEIELAEDKKSPQRPRIVRLAV